MSGPPFMPRAVLFACNFNRVRSPMAEGLLKRFAGHRVQVESCGLKLPPKADWLEEELGVDPFAYAVMAEVGCDLEAHRPKTFDDLEGHAFDLVISLTPESQHRAVELTRGQAEIEYWPIIDPTMTEGSRDMRLDAYREVRRSLEKRIAERFRP